MNKNRPQIKKPKEIEVKKGISRRSFLERVRGIGLFTAGSVMINGSPHTDETSKEDDMKTFGSKAHIIMLNVNGVQREVTVEPNETLADTLRNNLQLTGTKIVCDRGSCSSCTILLDGEPVNSCMTLIFDAVGKEIKTIESLAENGELHPLQQAFIDHDATQCGFCTPGMLMSCTHLLKINPHPNLDDVKKAISGNLCRCGTHPHVFKAVMEVSDEKKRH